MKKAPAFQFYPMDWLSDTNVVRMTVEQEGAYLRLLCYCWLDGSIPGNLDALIPLCKGIPKETIEAVLHCFIKKGDKLVHPRLDQERRKQAAFRKKMAYFGSLGGKKRYHKHYVPMDKTLQG